MKNTYLFLILLKNTYFTSAGDMMMSVIPDAAMILNLISFYLKSEIIYIFVTFVN